MPETPPTPTGPDLAAGVPFTDLVPDTPLLGHVHGTPVILVRSGDDVSAVSATCTHWHGPLAEGSVVGGSIRCPWHHACFDLQSGAVLGPPALDALTTYAVVHEGGTVRVGAERAAVTPSRPAEAPSAVVIVGAGAAGAACAEALRSEGYAGSITLASDEGPVDRPNLSKDYLAGKAEAAWIPLRPSAFYAEHDITVLTDDPVVTLEPAAHRVVLRSGRTLGYGALVLATGAEPVRLPIDGADRPHVLRLRTLADADAIIARAATARRAVVIGASFIGLEVAASLRTRGLEVAVVGPEAVPLATVLGPELGAYVRGLHAARGVRFHLGRKPTRIDDSGVTLDDGTVVAAELVVMGVGVKPRVALAEAAGLRVDRGIVVDASLRTSAADIYAAGDVARHPGATGLVRIEHWVVAMQHGRAIARTLVGRGAPFADVPFFWSQHYAVTIGYVGHAERWDDLRIDGSLEAGDATVTLREAGHIRAVITVGRDEVSLRAEAAMQRGDTAGLEAIVTASG